MRCCGAALAAASVGVAVLGARALREEKRRPGGQRSEVDACFEDESEDWLWPGPSDTEPVELRLPSPGDGRRGHGGVHGGSVDAVFRRSASLGEGGACCAVLDAPAPKGRESRQKERDVTVPRAAKSASAGSPRRRTALRRAWVAAWLLIAALLGSATLWALFTCAKPAPSPVAHVRVVKTKAIEDVELGERVAGRNPKREEVDEPLPEPDPATWRAIKLRVFKPNGNDVKILAGFPEKMPCGSNWRNCQGVLDDLSRGILHEKQLIPNDFEVFWVRP